MTERREALIGIAISGFSTLVSLVAVAMATHSMGWW